MIHMHAKKNNHGQSKFEKGIEPNTEEGGLMVNGGWFEANERPSRSPSPPIVLPSVASTFVSKTFTSPATRPSATGSFLALSIVPSFFTGVDAVDLLGPLFCVRIVMLMWFWGIGGGAICLFVCILIGVAVRGAYKEN